MATAPGETAAPSYAGLWERLAAYFVDTLAVGLVTVAICVVAVASYDAACNAGLCHYGGDTLGLQMFPPTWVLVAWVYRASFESSRLQATPGECWLRLEVTDLQGRGLGFGRATLRHLARFLSLLPAWLGLAGLLIPDLPDWGCGLILAVAIALTLAMAAILIRTTPRRQALHDLVAKTIVLKREVEGA